MLSNIRIVMTGGESIQIPIIDSNMSLNIRDLFEDETEKIMTLQIDEEILLINKANILYIKYF